MLKTQAWEQGIFGVEKACFRGWDLGLEHGKFVARNAFWHVSCSKPKSHPRKQAFPTLKMPCSQAWVLNIFSCAISIEPICLHKKY